MKDSIRKHPVTESLLYLLRWTGFALLTGSVGGLLGGLFALAIRKAGTLFSETAWLLARLAGPLKEGGSPALPEEMPFTRGNWRRGVQ